MLDRTFLLILINLILSGQEGVTGLGPGLNVQMFAYEDAKTPVKYHRENDTAISQLHNVKFLTILLVYNKLFHKAVIHVHDEITQHIHYLQFLSCNARAVSSVQ